MKVLLFSFFALLCILFSCQPSPKAQDGGEEDAQEEFVDTTPKATAIFWIDKAETKHCKEWGFRTVKAKVLIHENGKVDLEAFVKKQSPDMEKYVRHHLAKFQVSEKMLESGYVQPGEQFVQLRCLYGKVKAK